MLPDFTIISNSQNYQSDTVPTAKGKSARTRHWRSQQVARLEGQVRRTVQYVKKVMRYHGSQSTGDLVDTLFVKWLKNGQLEQILALTPGQRGLVRKVKAALIDRFRYHGAAKRYGVHAPYDDAVHAPETSHITSQVARDLSRWLAEELALLQRGHVDTSLGVAMPEPRQVAQVLTLDGIGCTQDEIAQQLQISSRSVSRRKRVGIEYLSLRARVQIRGLVTPESSDSASH